MKKIVLTGGPCAGKTTLTQVIARTFEQSVVTIPEAASLLFSASFPRWDEPLEARRATQRAIYHVQKELETSFTVKYPEKFIICDRGTIDGAAYWPEGVDNFFLSLGTTLEAELANYDVVIYLESAARDDYLIHRSRNPNRTEDWEEANRLDCETLKLWKKHPHLRMIQNQRSFGIKIHEVLSTLAEFMARPDEKK